MVLRCELGSDSRTRRSSFNMIDIPLIVVLDALNVAEGVCTRLAEDPLQMSR